jgi:hypothetical protein
MKTGMRPMDVQSPFLRDDLRQYQIPARRAPWSAVPVNFVRNAPRSPGGTLSDTVAQTTED